MEIKLIKIKGFYSFHSSRNNKKVFCNIRCKAEFQKTLKGKRAHKEKCIICGNEYFVKPSHIKNRKTCSKKCSRILLSSRKGKETANYKRGYWIHKKGYKCIGKKLEQRIIMEQILK